MFGYRVRFLPEMMKSYCAEGKPSANAPQFHKPLIYFVQDRLLPVRERYEKVEPYLTKQVIVKVLDSEDEEQAEEIERNKKLIKCNQRTGANAGNTNPKIKKRITNLPWYFNENQEDDLYIRKFSPKYRNDSKSNSPVKRRFGGTNRFNSNTLRYSQKLRSEFIIDKRNLQSNVQNTIGTTAYKLDTENE